MFRVNTLVRPFAIATLLAVVAAGCAASPDDGDPASGIPPAAAGTCPEGTPDCNDTPDDPALPPFAGQDGDDGAGPLGLVVDGGLTVAEALAYTGDEVIAVQGFVLTQDGTTRLCEALAESFPPQCGAAGVVITNPSALQDMVLIEEGTTQWSEDPVTILGNISNGQLTIASDVNALAVDPDDPEDGPRATEIDGVWVFEYSPNGGMDALHGGTPEIVDGCLVIDSTIVVWPSDKLDEAAAAIAAVKAGESPQLLIGGGGLSIEEGTDPSQIPASISELCPTDAVWFASP